MRTFANCSRSEEKGMNRFLKHFDPDLLRIYRYLLPHKWRIALGAVFMAGEASMSSLTATLLGKLTDLGFYQQEPWVIAGAPAALIGVTLLFAFCTVASSWVMAKVSQTVLITLRTELYDRIMAWPAERYQANPTGTICSKFVNEANVALSGATSSLIVLIRDSLQIIALLCLLFWQNWKLTLVAFVVGPLIVLTLKLIAKRIRVIVKRSQETVGLMLSRVQEAYEAQRVVKVTGSYAFEESRFEKVNRTIRRTALDRIKTESLATPITQMITMLGIAFVVAVALYQAQAGMLTIGEFITFLAALLLLKPALQHLTGLNGTFAAISTAAHSLFEVLDAEREVDEGTVEIERARGEIVFENVFLTYPGQNEPALRGINLTIRPGEHTALVGPSGSGKSSLVNLIPRFWEPTHGEIRLDGIPLREIRLASLRRQIAVVSQDIFLFDDTIRANIAYGLPDASEADIERAVQAAALDEFIASLPEGLNTRVGEGGSLLSGGQKQRISIARAVLKDAPILILDEATSALDSKNEALVKEALERLTRGKTCVTVAHRFSTIENVDRIVAMQGGEIVEEGTKEALLAQNGLFAKLYRLQMSQPETNHQGN